MPRAVGARPDCRNGRRAGCDSATARHRQSGCAKNIRRCTPLRRGRIRHRPTKPEFVAGTMFLARAEIFRPFLGRFSADDFAVSAKDDTVVTRAHLLERAIGFAACAAGRITDPDDSMRLRHLKSDICAATAPLCRFLYQTKTTRSGARLVKVCRLPVWHARKPAS